MAHEIESMFFVGETPWHGLGTRLGEAPTVADAIRDACINEFLPDGQDRSGGPLTPGT